MTSFYDLNWNSKIICQNTWHCQNVSDDIVALTKCAAAHMLSSNYYAAKNADNITLWFIWRKSETWCIILKCQSAWGSTIDDQILLWNSN